MEYLSHALAIKKDALTQYEINEFGSWWSCLDFLPAHEADLLSFQKVNTKTGFVFLQFLQ